VTYWVSIKVNAGYIRYDGEALTEGQMTEYTSEKEGRCLLNRCTG